VQQIPLLITEGASGVRLLCNGRECFIAARPVEARHTIGAGDTLLAAIGVALVDGADLFAATERGVRFTEHVLRERETAHVPQEQA
jgi:fructose-1-phosphate kinase PfkB-like protein